MSAEKLADYAEDYASPERIRTLRAFRRWVQANKAQIEQRVLFGSTKQSTKADWITPRVTDEAWRLLRERRWR